MYAEFALRCLKAGDILLSSVLTALCSPKGIIAVIWVTYLNSSFMISQLHGIHS